MRELAAAGLIVLADKGYAGAGDHIRTPCKGKNKPESQKAANRAHAKLRGPGERANAQLKTWRILRKLRCCPWKAGQLAKAIHVLQARDIEGMKKAQCRIWLPANARTSALPPWERFDFACTLLLNFLIAIARPLAYEYVKVFTGAG